MCQVDEQTVRVCVCRLWGVVGGGGGGGGDGGGGLGVAGGQEGRILSWYYVIFPSSILKSFLQLIYQTLS